MHTAASFNGLCDSSDACTDANTYCKQESACKKGYCICKSGYGVQQGVGVNTCVQGDYKKIYAK